MSAPWTRLLPDSEYERLCQVAVVAPYRRREQAERFLRPDHEVVCCDGEFFVVPTSALPPAGPAPSRSNERKRALFDGFQRTREKAARLRIDDALGDLVADLEHDLTAILGQRPDLVSVRFERTKDHVFGETQTQDRVRIEVWAQCLRTAGRNISASACSIDGAVQEILDFARKASA